jgi:hypothetical protein
MALKDLPGAYRSVLVIKMPNLNQAFVAAGCH